MSTDLIPVNGSPFDRIRQIRPDGTEFWSARQLQVLMGYAAWRNFQPAMARAVQTASNTGMDTSSHFAESRKIVERTQGGGRLQEDVELSRDAAYLVAMNGDPNKPEVAAAQVYFAGRTRESEVAQQRAASLPAWAAALHALVDQQAAMEIEQRRQAEHLTLVSAKVAAIEGAHDEFTALGFAKLNDFPTDRPYLARVGAAASRLMRERDQEPRKRQDATFGTVNVYPLWALEEAFSRTPERGAS